MDQLSIRKLPCLSKTGERTQDFKTRVDPTLANFVHESIQRKCPHVRVGKRFSLEWVLLKYLYEEGLLNESPVVPGLSESDPLSIARKSVVERNHGTVS
jgi:hypothetical protein